MKRSKIVFGVTYSVNLLESLLLPFLLMADIAAGFTSVALMWTLIALEFALWCGTAITANVIAEGKYKKLWFASFSPLIFILPTCVFVNGSQVSDLWLIILSAIIIVILFCLTPFLISAAHQKKKNSTENNKEKFQDNNETV
ncbi:MAG: hypothetical protein NC332_03675 [Firmicutes bacterium]|nr:hypothetical protein [Bacillota bacterium]